ncbi:hypothetical protein AArcSl_0762 [Halalkaliarchaeum desulfuricum]|uniref:DUF433 domain-containing protein n=1 Tax=Halalkaliarchaeum desulfuricum TaxID=2055893 RepID=A0A343TH36_9EURY|nr:DUF433 domain-containing protein [Halalkaliarchaeum desulfuricum]AUX08408.1 hypothetical protein AArcSl_0762 [Halalkaliarchaeum desulfuricum]
MRGIVSTDGVMGGQPRIEGRRISVLQIVEWVHEEGMDPETVAAEFDLDMADIYRALAYYYDNVESMDPWRERRQRRLREGRDDQHRPDSASERV